MDFGMWVSVVCVERLVVRGVFPHVFLRLHGVGLHCCRGGLSFVCVFLSVSASAEHLTVNINHLSCRGSIAQSCHILVTIMAFG